MENNGVETDWQEHQVETFLIKRQEPLSGRAARTKGGRGQRANSKPRIWSEDESVRKAPVGVAAQTSISSSLVSGSNNEEENNTDWSPEIPFENVCSTFLLIHFHFSSSQRIVTIFMAWSSIFISLH